MKENIFIRRLIFALSSGSLLFYLISFDSRGQTMGDESEQCRSDLQMMRAGRPVPLRKRYRVVPSNVLKLSSVEQKALTNYTHLTGITLFKNGQPNPIKMSSYKMESGSRRALGYKIVIDSERENDDVLTYYLTKSGDILFWYWDTFQPLQEWACEMNSLRNNENF